MIDPAFSLLDGCKQVHASFWRPDELCAPKKKIGSDKNLRYHSPYLRHL
jgi:hypothetical protein